MNSASHHAGLRSLLLSVLVVTLGLRGTSSCEASGLYDFHLSGHTVSTNSLLAGIVTIGDPYSLHLGFEISTPNQSSDPKTFASDTPDAIWYLTIGKYYSRTFTAGTAFELSEQPGGVPQFDVSALHPVTIRGMEFAPESINALRLGGIILAEPYPSDGTNYRLGTVLYADYNAPGSELSRFIIGDVSNPAFLGTIEHISLAPDYLFSPVPEPATYALGGLTLAAAAAVLRIKRRRKLSC